MFKAYPQSMRAIIGWNNNADWAYASSLRQMLFSISLFTAQLNKFPFRERNSLLPGLICHEFGIVAGAG